MNQAATDTEQQEAASQELSSAPETAPQTALSPEERLANIEKQLGVGRFAAQQAISLGLQFGGAILGYFAGKGLGKAGIGQKEIFEGDKSLNISSAAGAIIGLVVGGTAAGFRGWKKMEGERLAVQEINKDVATIMESRAGFEETLRTQGEVVSEMRERVMGPVGNKTAAVIDGRLAAANTERVR